MNKIQASVLGIKVEKAVLKVLAKNSFKTDEKLERILRIIREKGYSRVGSESELSRIVRDPQLLKQAIKYFREGKLE
jgi:predicted RNA binding protein with dsRBD fold (UPF0201 family)